MTDCNDYPAARDAAEMEAEEELRQYEEELARLEEEERLALEEFRELEELTRAARDRHPELH